MKVELKHFAARPEHRFSDSTFLVFMSHGILDGICGTKHREEEPDVLHDDTIFQIFNNRNCRNLKDKPKVIIMQACRGSELELGDAGGGRPFFSVISLVSSLRLPRAEGEKPHCRTARGPAPERYEACIVIEQVLSALE